MRLGTVGSGIVAQTIGLKLAELGHEVMISSRNLDAPKDRGPQGTLPSVNQWVQQQSERGLAVRGGSFAEAAQFGEVVFNCTFGVASVEALTAAGKDNLSGKILVDIANPLDFSGGMPPTLAFCNTESLGERIQAAFPEAKVVKALNTVNASIMTNPSLVPGAHDLFVAGNDAEAKAWVKEKLLKEWFGWASVIDLGDISSARGIEMYLILWLRLLMVVQRPNFNIKVAM
ncbi:MAG: NAD(P)-binding domain-containing protein [Dehalococcoidia bacterium]|jgi:predicted dinucleotide-binding enzyme